VVPASTSPEKLDQIRFQGGRCELVDDPARVEEEARRIAEESGGHFIDQFTYAERATDWRGNNNIAESIFEQMRLERHPVPRWLVVGAGTGGTSATLGRYVRYRRYDTEVCLVDPEGSVYADSWEQHDRSLRAPASEGLIEGVGRPKVEASFIPDVVDRVQRVPDAASVAGARVVRRLLGRRVGASTGTNVWGALKIVAEMLAAGDEGSVVSLICDPGDRYEQTIYNEAWLADRNLRPEPYEDLLDRFLATGEWPPT